MEDNLQLLIYIVFGIIYLIFGALKKRRQGQQPPGGPMAPYAEEDEETVFQEPRSLEELLERYEDAANRAKRKAADKVESMQEQVDDEFVPVAPQQPLIRNMEAEAMEQIQRTERLKSLQEELPAKARVEMQDQQVRSQLKARSPLKPKSKKKPLEERGRFKPYEKQKRTAGLLQQLQTTAQSKKGMQQAIVLSEILNKKYF